MNKLKKTLDDCIKSGGYTLIKKTEHELILEKKNLRISFYNNADKFFASLLIPHNQCNILSFNRIWNGADIRFVSSEKIELKISIGNLASLTDVFAIAENSIAISDEEKLPVILKPVPTISGMDVSLEMVSSLNALLLYSKAVIITGDKPTIYSLINRLDIPFIYEVNPLISYSIIAEQFCTLQNLSRRTVIVMDLSHMSDDNVKPLLSAIEMYHLNESVSGPAFLISTLNQRLPENSIPCLELCSTFASIEESVSQAGLKPDLPTLSSIKMMIKSEGVTLPEAIMRHKQIMSYSSGLGNKSTLRFKHSENLEMSLLNCSEKNITELTDIASKHIEKNMVGNKAMQLEIAQLLAIWWLTSMKSLCFCFCGPSGTGKNHLAEIISLILADFASREPSLIICNCGSLIGQHSLWSLQGVQSGLKGANRRGLLEQAQYGSVFVWDELDKTNPEVGLQSFLMELIDQQSYMNGMAQRVRLPKMLFIMAMNAGAEAHSEKFNRIGFVEASQEDLIKHHYMAAYERHIILPLRGRLDQVFFFDRLQIEDLKEIARRELHKTEQTLSMLGLSSFIGEKESLIERVVLESDIALGARSIKHRIQNLEREIIRDFTKGKYRPGTLTKEL